MVHLVKYCAQTFIRGTHHTHANAFVAPLTPFHLYQCPSHGMVYTGCTKPQHESLDIAVNCCPRIHTSVLIMLQIFTHDHVLFLSPHFRKIKGVAMLSSVQVFCKPKIMPLKSVTLEKLERMQKEVSVYMQISLSYFVQCLMAVLIFNSGTRTVETSRVKN